MEQNNLDLSKTPKLVNYGDLKLRIEKVKEVKEIQEIELKESIHKLAHALSPVRVAKSALNEFVNDKEVQFDLVKGGLNMGADFIIEKLFHKQNSIKGYLSSVIVEKFSASFIQKNAPQIIIGITEFISLLSNQKDEPAQNDETEEEKTK
jgi:hypothetical protein